MDAGFPTVVHGLFPNGGLDLIVMVFEKNNRDFAKKFPPFSPRPDYSFREYLKEAIKARLLMSVERRISDTTADLAELDRRVDQAAYAQLYSPQNALVMGRLVGHLVDDIWYLSGDRTVQVSYSSANLSLQIEEEILVKIRL